MRNIPKKIAVLGGGVSAMTTIYNLMQEPDWQQKYDITVYQLGWRIGGKGASGVNRKIGDRIEEHGLHLWMGFYENAFRMMQGVYKGLNRPLGAPLATFDDAFKPQAFFVFEEHINQKWIDWQINFPTLAGKPGDGIMPDTKQFWEMWIKFIIDHLINFHVDSEQNAPPKNARQKFMDWLAKLWHKIFPKKNTELSYLEGELLDWVKGKLAIFEQKAAQTFIQLGEKSLKFLLHLLEDTTNFAEKEMQHFFSFLAKLKGWLWDLLERLIEKNNLARRLWIIIDFGFTLVKGLLQDKIIVLEQGKMIFNFDSVNQEDYIEWLIRHGADQKLTVPSPIVRSMYDGPFAFVKGNVNQPNIEAGTILRIFLRMALTCKESIVWKMQAGMGDTIFAPIYELMEREGVKFKFFQNVRNLKLSADKNLLESIEIGEQVTLTKPYEPLVNIKGLPCWCSTPNYEFINPQEAQALQEQNIDLECYWTAWEDKNIVHLQKGTDFDEVVIGFSLASIPHLCKEIVEAKANWQKMIAHVQTVQTQAYQLWFNQNPKTLEIDTDKLASTYVEPVDTFAAMNHLLVRENWTPEQNVQYVAYLCGVFDELAPIPPKTDHTFPAQEQKRVEQNFQTYLKKHLQHLVNGAYDSQGNFKENYLTSSYVRANISPSERYVLSVKGSSKYRIFTNETGVSNLYITGDWIQNGFNAGFVEGAAVAGIWTARKVSGNNDIPIIGENWNH